jgi:hypothetical protein
MHEQGTAVIEGMSPQSKQEIVYVFLYRTWPSATVVDFSKKLSEILSSFLEHAAINVPYIDQYCPFIAGNRSRRLGWTTYKSEFNSRQGQEMFFFSITSIPTLGPTQPPIQWVRGAYCSKNVASLYVREACGKILLIGVYTFSISTFTSLLVVILVYCWFKSMWTVQKPYCIVIRLFTALVNER